MHRTTPLPDPTHPYVLARDEGPHGHFLNNLVTTKATASAGGSLAVVEAVAPRGFGPPLHRHEEEDEIIVVLEGEVVFRSGDDEMVATDGGLAYLPHGIPHTFQVLSTTARMLNIAASASTTPQFDVFVAALSTPTETAEVPEPAPIDGGRVAQIGKEHGIQILGPPPPALDD